MRDRITAGTVDFIRTQAGIPGEPTGMPTMGESLTASLEGRRVLMVARDAAVADSVAAVLSGEGVPVQRVTADERGLATDRLADDDGQPLLPTGTVTIADIDTWRASMETSRITRAADAIDTVVRSSQRGSTTDHLMLLVSQEDALRDCGRVLNLLADRMVEADLVDQVGGPDGVSPMIRRFMRWLPQDAAAASAMGMYGQPGPGKSATLAHTGERKTMTTRPVIGDDVVLIAPTGQPSRALAEIAAVASAEHPSLVVKLSDVGTRGSANPVDNPDFEAGWPEGVRLADMDGYKTDMAMIRGTSDMIEADADRFLHVRVGPSDEMMGRLFGDDVIAREREARMTITRRDDMCLRDIAFERVDLPAPGFDHRAVNEAFNQRRQVRGSRGDRRSNRGGKGRR